MSATGRSVGPWLAAAALVALVGIGWVLFGRSEPESVTPGRAAGVEAGAAAAADPVATSPSTASEQPSAASEAPVGNAVDGASDVANDEPPAMATKTEAPTARKASGLVRGRVVDAAGEPVGGVEVTPSLTGLAILEGIVKEAPDPVTTDASGSFELDLGLAASFSLEFEHDEYAPRKRGAVRGRSDEAVELEDIVLSRGGRVSGRVVDENGAPVEGAELWVAEHHGLPFAVRTFRADSEPDAVTAADGSFSIDHVLPGVSSLHAKRTGFAPAERSPLSIEENKPLENIEVVLPPGHSIAGRVLGPNGAPVAEAKVAARSGEFAMIDRAGLEDFGIGHMEDAAMTAADGSFRIDSLAEGNYRVVATAENFASASEASVATGRDDLELRLRATGSIRGRVLAAKGDAPVTSFRVALQRAGGSGMMFRIGGDGSNDVFGPETFTSADGTYVLEGVNPGSYRVVARAEGFADAMTGTVTVEPGAVVAAPDARLTPGGVLEGVVRRAKDKTSLVGARVKAYKNAAPGEGHQRTSFIIAGGSGRALDLGRPSKTAETDDAGRFRFDELAGGTYSIEISHPLYVAETIKDVVVEPGVEVEPLVIDLRRGGALEGTVFDPDGYTMSGKRVEVRAARGFFESTSTDGFGNYALGGLAPGDYFVKLAADDDGSGAGIMVFESISIGDEHDDEELPTHVPATDIDGEPVTIREGEVARLDLFDRLKGSIEGVVTEGGQRADGVRVALRKAGGAFVMPEHRVSDDKGGVLFEDLEAGKYVVSVSSDDETRRVFSETVEVGDGEAVDLDIDLPTAYIEGVVVSHPGNQPLSGMRVTLRETRDPNEMRIEIRAGGDDREIRTDAEGRFRVSRVGAGTYTLLASGPGRAASAMENLEVAEGEPVTGIKLRLSEGGAVRGIVTGPDGKPVQFSMVRILDTSGQPLPNHDPTVSGQDGTFEIEGIAEGDYLIEAAQGMPPGTRTRVRIRGGETEQVSLSLGGA